MCWGAKDGTFGCRVWLGNLLLGCMRRAYPNSSVIVSRKQQVSSLRKSWGAQPLHTPRRLEETGGVGDGLVTGQAPCCSISTSAVMSNPQGQSVPDLPPGLTIHQASCNSGLFNEDGWGLRTGALECCGPSRCLHVTLLLQIVDQVSEGNDPCDPCSWRRDSWNGNGEAFLAPPWVVATCKFIWSEERSPFICGETDRVWV